jgi:hypothetical protein
MWLAHLGFDTVTKHSDRTGAQLQTFPVQDAPEGALFDGTSIWVSNFGSDSVTKITHTEP